jgi:hypothetical protein
MTQTTVRAALAAAVLGLSAAPSVAQTKVLQGETRTVTATVESIEASTRSATIKKDDGTYDVMYFPEGIKRFDTLKIGDTLTARYYENMVVKVKQPGTPDASKDTAALVVPKGASAATISTQQTITATIAAIDMKVPSISLVGPNGWKYVTRVEDKKALAKVKVGDKLDITWTRATIVSIQ